jgi:hypothetical protein
MPHSFSETVLQVMDGIPSVLGGMEAWPHEQDSSQPAISAIAACARFLLIAQPGHNRTTVTRVSLPDLQFHSSRAFPHLINRLWLNGDGSRVAMVDPMVGALASMQE